MNEMNENEVRVCILCFKWRVGCCEGVWSGVWGWLELGGRGFGVGFVQLTLICKLDNS